MRHRETAEDLRPPRRDDWALETVLGDLFSIGALLKSLQFFQFWGVGEDEPSESQKNLVRLPWSRDFHSILVCLCYLCFLDHYLCLYVQKERLAQQLRAMSLASLGRSDIPSWVSKLRSMADTLTPPRQFGGQKSSGCQKTRCSVVMCRVVWCDQRCRLWSHHALQVIGDMCIHIQYAYIIYITLIMHQFRMIFLWFDTCYIEHLADWITARLLQCLIFREMRFDKSSLQLLNRSGAGHELLKETVDIYFLDGSSTVSSIQIARLTSRFSEVKLVCISEVKLVYPDWYVQSYVDLEYFPLYRDDFHAEQHIQPSGCHPVSVPLWSHGWGPWAVACSVCWMHFWECTCTRVHI